MEICDGVVSFVKVAKEKVWIEILPSGRGNSPTVSECISLISLQEIQIDNQCHRFLDTGCFCFWFGCKPGAMSERWRRGICEVEELGETWRGLEGRLRGGSAREQRGSIGIITRSLFSDSCGDDVDQTLGIPGPIGL